MAWAQKTLTTGELNPGNELGQIARLWVAGYFAVGPLLENRIKHIVCTGFARNK
jgi:hypothetical protein